MSVFGNPQTQVAFSVFENKGVFALLLGSGLSRAAEIPTGWEITTDLVRRIATAEGVEEQADWAQWYRETHGEEPDYSALLDGLSSTPAERRQIIHSYIEPDEEDREEGRKVPTAGHKAIAQLVRDGFIRVIVTTNFDRLMENALIEIGVQPTVVGSPDALKGAEPLVHTACYILKLHGDYKDARILNTEDELSVYPVEYNMLLDRILDEYGLIVCGWSGEWDAALRAAIQRAPNRRYPLFWATRGALKGRGKELCDQRRGIEVPIADADRFFTELSEQVRTLADSRKRNPADVDMLLARAKRYLSKAEHAIQLADLVDEEARRVIAALDGQALPPHGHFTPEEFQRRVSVYEGAVEGLAKVCGLIGRWGTSQQLRLVVEAIKSLVDHAESVNGGLVVFTEMRRYPAVLIYQACALGLVKAERWQELRQLLAVEVDTGYAGRQPISEAVCPLNWKGGDRGRWNTLEGLGNRYVPLSDHLHDGVYSKWGQSFIASMSGFSDVFMLSELLVAITVAGNLTRAQVAEILAQPGRSGQPNTNFIWVPVGRAGYDRGFRTNIKTMFENPAFLADLAEAGYGGGDMETIKLLFENYIRCAASMKMF